MRKIVLQMMTTLNGRLDDPMAWVHGVSEDQYADIDRAYATYDTVLVGRTTYEEMASYWPNALRESIGTETNQRMAKRMNDYRKLVFTRSGREAITPWHNTEQVVTGSDAELAKYLRTLKAQAGGAIHLSGGSSFARSVIATGLVDEFQFYVYPAVSPGTSWFAELPEMLPLTMLESRVYENGVVRVAYAPRESPQRERPSVFTELLT